MKKPIAYFHIDTESTTLDRFSGHVRSIGWIITDGNLEELGRGEVEVLVDPMLWDPETLKWAKGVYSEEDIISWEIGGNILWEDIAQELMQWFLPVVQDWKIVKDYEIWTITNHPEFDMCMLEMCCRLAGMKDKWPFKYSRNLDWQSLYLAYNAGDLAAIDQPIQYYKEILARADPVKGKENVVHTALADVERQLGVLRNVGVVLPLHTSE